MKMPFGKYKNNNVHELPPKYCEVLLANIPIKNKALLLALEARAQKPSYIRKYNRLNPHRSYSMGSGEIHTSYGIIDYLDDGNGNVYDSSYDSDDNPF